jgi:hypothetical protein
MRRACARAAAIRCPGGLATDRQWEEWPNFDDYFACLRLGYEYD